MIFAHEEEAQLLFDVLRFLAKPSSLQVELLNDIGLQSLREHVGTSKMLFSALRDYEDLCSYVIHPDQEKNQEGEQLLVEIEAFISILLQADARNVPKSLYINIDLLDSPAWCLLRRLANEALIIYKEKLEPFKGDYHMMFTNL